MQYSRTNQGGSVLAFVVVGVLLAGLVVGGVYLLRQRGEQARTAPPVANKTDGDKQNQPQTPAKPTEDKKPADKPTATSQNTPAPAQGSTTQIPATGQTTPPVAETQTGTKPNVASGVPLDHSANLPVTGPFDTALQLLAAGTLTALTIAYIRSRLQTIPSL